MIFHFHLTCTNLTRLLQVWTHLDWQKSHWNDGGHTISILHSHLGKVTKHYVAMSWKLLLCMEQWPVNYLISVLHIYCVISLSSCCLLLYHAPILCLCGYISLDCTVLSAAVLMRFLPCHDSEGTSLLVQSSVLQLYGCDQFHGIIREALQYNWQSCWCKVISTQSRECRFPCMRIILT